MALTYSALFNTDWVSSFMVRIIDALNTSMIQPDSQKMKWNVTSIKRRETKIKSAELLQSVLLVFRKTNFYYLQAARRPELKFDMCIVTDLQLNFEDFMSNGKVQVPKLHYIEIVMGGSQCAAQSYIGIATINNSSILWDFDEWNNVSVAPFNSCSALKRKGLMRLD